MSMGDRIAVLDHDRTEYLGSERRAYGRIDGLHFVPEVTAKLLRSRSFYSSWS
jgi:hypothetical protein